MKKEVVKALIKNAKENRAKCIGVSIHTQGMKEDEIIINGYENFDEKLRYYSVAYDDDMILIEARGKARIEVTGIVQGDSFADIEWQLTQDTDEWKGLISDAIERVVKKYTDSQVLSVDERRKYNFFAEAMKQLFIEQRRTPRQNRFVAENIELYEELFENAMNGTDEEFHDRFTELTKMQNEA